MAEERRFIPEEEFEDAQIKWAFSHFDGRADTFNDEGDHNFTIIVPRERAMEMMEYGWAIRELEPREEGDEPEFILKVKISYRYDPPKIYLIKGDRKMRASEPDLADIRRDVTEQISVIITPSRWINGNRSGVTAYVKELYAKVRQSRFSEMYADYEEI